MINVPNVCCLKQAYQNGYDLASVKYEYILVELFQGDKAIFAIDSYLKISVDTGVGKEGAQS